jgi:hypothetical protein
MFCGTKVDTRTAYRKVQGWEHPRKAGGTNALALREPFYEWACDMCIREQKRDQVKGQEQLWG